MINQPRYAILGRGRWAKIMHKILMGEGRQVTVVEETRQALSEDEASYRLRLSSALAATGAVIAWLCVPPGPAISSMMEAAILAGLHVVAEKPWRGSRAQTDLLTQLASERGLLLAVHYQYCCLEAVERWRTEYHDNRGLRFGGRFLLNRGNRLGIAAIENMGSHLLSIREYAVPQAEVSRIDCSYNSPDERCIWLAEKDTKIESLDFLFTKEPLIQRFMMRLETALNGGHFPFDLQFAQRVANAVEEASS